LDFLKSAFSSTQGFPLNSTVANSSHAVGLVGEGPVLFERLRLWTGLPGTTVSCLRLDDGGIPGEAFPVTCRNSLDALAGDSPALFDFCLPPERLRKAFGGLLRKRGCYLLSGSTLPVAPADLEWLERLVRNNRLELSLAGSLRYHPGAARLREWRETGLLAGKLEISFEFPRAGIPAWAWLDLSLWLLGAGTVVEDDRCGILVDGDGGQARLRSDAGVIRPRVTVKANGTEAEWDGGNDLILRRQGTERRLDLPGWHPAAEAGCRLQELAEAKRWLVFPTEETLRLLRQAARIGDR
jgi:hypothetical protein